MSFWLEGCNDILYSGFVLCIKRIVFICFFKFNYACPVYLYTLFQCLLNVITGVPSAPESIHVRKVGKNFVDLEWSPPKSDGGAKINVYRIYKSTVLPAEWKEVAKVRCLYDDDRRKLCLL